MESFLDNILIYIVFSPLLAAAILLLIPNDEKSLLRRLALIFSLGTLALIIALWLNYDRVDAGFQFQVRA
jgi:NADH:ubiquinone oxidoreductase subunit 4 (subunit M)